jgi:hypothetical protein
MCELGSQKLSSQKFGSRTLFVNMKKFFSRTCEPNLCELNFCEQKNSLYQC